MKDLITEYAGRTLPRYTSYPTAPHFTDALGSEEYAAWLGAARTDTAPNKSAASATSANAATDGSLSLYLHIPYCRHICHYCGCHTKATLRDAPVTAYAETLIRELTLLHHHLDGTSLQQTRPKLSHIHWGGGTPSLLPPDDFTGITETVAAAFDITKDVEHAIELDPRTVTPDLAALLYGAGINRVSLGVQDFNPPVQTAIGRVQPFATVADAVAMLRDAGLTRLSFDLMYGLPHQGEVEVAKTVECALSLQPDRISLFGYAHVPWMKKHQRRIDTNALPGVTARFKQAALAARRLTAEGYRRIGLDHFALPGDSLSKAAADGTLRRNFQGYTCDGAKTLIGAGASAISRLPQGFVQNEPDIGNWRRRIEAGELPVIRGKRLSLTDRVRGDVIEQLMCRFEADLGQICSRHGVSTDLLAGWRAALEPLERDGLVEISGQRVRVPPECYAFVRLAAAAFDAYLKPDCDKPAGVESNDLEPTSVRHSVAV